MVYLIFLFLSLFSRLQTEEHRPPFGLPSVPWPEDNPYSHEKAELGRLLYFDKRLSTDNTISCAHCHNAPCNYSDCQPIAIGIDERKGTRHTPTIINTAYNLFFLWDGGSSSLEDQCTGPIGNTREMTTLTDPHAAHLACAEKVNTIPGYRKLFKEIFGVDEVAIDEIAKAVATFERTLLSGNSPFDRYLAGAKSALSTEQKRGLAVFKTVGCTSCHGGFNFTDGRFYNIGVGMDDPNPDIGRMKYTQLERDWGAFKTPTLRECAYNNHFMHNGSLNSLEEVIDYYDKGGTPNHNLHPLMKPLHLSDDDKQALVAFIQALSGEGWQHFKEPEDFPK